MKNNLIRHSIIGKFPATSLRTEFKEANLSQYIEQECSIVMYGFEYETKFLDSNVKASASISFPVDASSKALLSHSLLTYNHGTITLRDQVSSVQGFNTHNDGLISKLFCSNKFITLIPDYLGLGSSNILHPYLHAESLAYSIKDAIQAATFLCKELQFELNSKLFLTGYSEGGFATMAAQKLIESNPVDGISLIGSAPLGGPYDLSKTMLEIMLSKAPYPAPSYAPYIMLAYNVIYGFEENSEDLFKQPLSTKLETLFDGTNSREEIETHLPEIPIEVLKEEIIEAILSDPNHQIKKALEKNDVYNFIPKTKTKLFHNPSDKTVPIQNAVVAEQHFKSKGKDVCLKEIQAEDHASAALPCILEATEFFGELR